MWTGDADADDSSDVIWVCAYDYDVSGEYDGSSDAAGDEEVGSSSSSLCSE